MCSFCPRKLKWVKYSCPFLESTLVLTGKGWLSFRGKDTSTYGVLYLPFLLNVFLQFLAIGDCDSWHWEDAVVCNRIMW